jgi:hypothetical protein
MSKRYRELWPDQERAKWAVKNAVRRGKLIKPCVCEKCGKRFAKRMIEAHHWSYLREHWTDVVWLCRWCHNKLHNKLGPSWKEPAVKPVFAKPQPVEKFEPSAAVAAMPDIY